MGMRQEVTELCRSQYLIKSKGANTLFSVFAPFDSQSMFLNEGCVLYCLYLKASHCRIVLCAEISNFE